MEDQASCERSKALILSSGSNFPLSKSLVLFPTFTTQCLKFSSGLDKQQWLIWGLVFCALIFALHLTVFTEHCIKRQSNNCVQPAADGPGEQCRAPLPFFFIMQDPSRKMYRTPAPDLRSPLCQHVVSSSVSIPFSILPFQHWHGLVCGSSTPSCAWLRADSPQLHPSHQPPPPISPVTLVIHFFTSLSIFLCLSTHLSSQRILHWSNECPNSACCIKCWHPYKLHPLQGIGVIGSGAMLESLVRAPLHRFTCSWQSPKPITTPEVAVLTSAAVSLRQQLSKFAFKDPLYKRFDEIQCKLIRCRVVCHAYSCWAVLFESWDVLSCTFSLALIGL